MLAPRDFEADEKQCRRQSEQAQAQLDATSGSSDQPKPDPKERADREKNAREYCVQRRSALASEYQGDVAKWAAGVGFLALAAAVVAAFAALRTVRTMQEIAKRELRAYVVAMPDLIDFGRSTISAVVIDIRNGGNTPAKNVQLSFATDVLPYPLPDRFVTSLSDSQKDGGISLGPQFGRPIPFPVGGGPTDEEAAHLQAKTHRFYVFLVVRYKDVFDERHTTKICASVPGPALMRILAQSAVDGTKIESLPRSLWELHEKHCYSD
jgi:hypothetical protein